MELFKLFGSIFIDDSDANRRLDQADKKAGGIGATFGKMGKLVSGAGGVIANTAISAGKDIMSMAKASSDTLGSIAKQSQLMGMSTKAYQEWKYAIEQSGGSMDKLKIGMKTLSVDSQKAIAGNKGMIDSFNQLGISQAQLKNMSQEELFGAVMKGLSGMESGAKRTTLANQLLGKSGVDLAPVFNKGAEGLEGLKKQANDLGLVYDEELINKSKGVGKSMATIEKTFESLKTKLGASFAPVIVNISNLILKFLPQIINKIMPAIDIIVNAFGKLLTSILPIFTKLINTLMPTFDQLIKIILQIAKTAIVPLINAILPIIQMILPILTKLITELITFIMPVINVLMDLIKTILPPLIEVVKVLIETALKILIQVFNALKPSIKLILDIIVKLIKEGLLQLIVSLLPLIQQILPVLTQLLILILPIITVALELLLKLVNLVLPPLLQLITFLVKLISDGLIIVFKYLGDVVLPIVTKYLTEFWNVLKEVFTIENIKNTFNNILESIKKGVNDFVNAVIGFFTWMKDSIVNVVSGLINGIVNFFTFLYTTASNIVKTFVDFIVGCFQWMYNHNYFFKAIVDFIIERFTAAKEFISVIWNAITSFLATTWDFIKNIVSGAVNAVYNFISERFNAAKEIIGIIWNALSGIVSGIWDGVKTTIVNIVGTIYNFISEKFSAIKKAITGPLGDAKDGITKIFDEIKGMFDKFIKSAMEWGSNLLGNFVKGIKGKIKDVKKGVEEVAKVISNFLGFHSPAKEGPGADADKWVPNFMNMMSSGFKNEIPGLKKHTLEVQTNFPNPMDFNGIGPIAPLNLKQSSNQIVIDKRAFEGAFIMDNYTIDKLLNLFVKRLKDQGVNVK